MIFRVLFILWKTLRNFLMTFPTKISTQMSGILKTRYLHFLLFYLPFLSCTPSNLAKVSERRSDIILLDSYYEQNTPGLRGAPKSTEYFFKIRLNTNKKVLFDSVWIADSCFPVFVSPLSGPISSTPISYKKNDVILVRASSLSTQANTPPPMAYQGEALIKYSVANQPKFLIVQKVIYQETAPMH